MIVIKKGQVNNLVVTLNERVTISNPLYLMQLKSKFNTTQERFVYIQNISNNRIRYDEFIVEEKDNPDYELGEVDLFTGEWEYIIYQTEYTDFDITRADKVLEYGMLLVISDDYN